MKVALCAIARHENKYLKEWIEHYKNMNVDHIILGDNNNELDDEDIATFINDNGYSDYVTVINKKRKEGELFTVDSQIAFYNEVYKRYNDQYDWIMFFDIDEFMQICPNFCENDIHSYIKISLTNAKHNYNIEADQLFVGWMIYGDNNNIFYEDKPVQERFTEITDQIYLSQFNNLVYTGKCILRTNCPAKFTTTMHNACGIDNYSLITISSGGCVWNNYTYEVSPFYHNDAFLKHYFTKSLEEFIQRKIDNNNSHYISFDNIVENYFRINKKTLEKTKVAELYRKICVENE